MSPPTFLLSIPMNLQRVLMINMISEAISIEHPQNPGGSAPGILATAVVIEKTLWNMAKGNIEEYQDLRTFDARFTRARADILAMQEVKKS